MKCCMCRAVILVEPIHVGDLMGFHASDVACSEECSDAAVYESHAANVDGESCRCNTCWRAARREAHTQVALYRAKHGWSPDMVIAGERFCEQLGGE